MPSGGARLMKVRAVISLVALTMVLASGCVRQVEVATVEKERVDQALAGNRGFIGGNNPPVSQKAAESQDVRTRTVYQIKMELPNYDLENGRTEDKELWGNRGYISGGRSYGPSKSVVSREQENEPALKIDLPEESKASAAVPVVEEEPEVILPREAVVRPLPEPEPAYTVYTVQKGDTLGKVAKKVYGRSSAWKSIFDANQDVLKNPDKIYPGQKLRIPRE